MKTGGWYILLGVGFLAVYVGMDESVGLISGPAFILVGIGELTRDGYPHASKGLRVLALVAFISAVIIINIT
jgi:hypothetical protein